MSEGFSHSSSSHCNPNNIMKSKFLIFTAFAAALLASQAQAISWTYSDYRDVDFVGEVLSHDSSKGVSSIEGTFEISSEDGDSYTWDRHTFDNSAEQLIGAEIGLGFYHKNGGVLTYLGDFRYYLGANLLPFVGSTGSLGFIEGFDLQVVNPFIGELTGDLLIELNDNGVLDWKVELNDGFQGEVTLHWAALAADAEPIPDSGSTFAMLGMVAFAAIIVRRRMQLSR